MSLSPTRLQYILDFVDKRYKPPSTSPDNLPPEFRAIISAAWAPSTRRNYNYSIRRFLDFCNIHHFHFDLTSPTPEITLCHFIVSLITSHSGSYIRSELAALKALHIVYNLEFPSSQRIQYLLRAADNLTPSTSRRQPRNPITLSMLAHLASVLDHSDPLDVCCLAVACCAFWGQARLGELLPATLTIAKHNPLPELSHLRPPSTPAGSRVLHIPWSKTTLAAGASIFLPKQNHPADPISALQLHILTNSPTTGPIFSYRIRGTLVVLSKPKFLARVSSCFTSTNFPHITGHSFRIGGTTELLLRRVDPKVVQVMGRWSSDAFLRYWRSIDILGPLHTELITSL